MITCCKCGVTHASFVVACTVCTQQTITRNNARSFRATDIEDLELSVRATTGLRNLGITTVGELLQWTVLDLCRCPNFGARSRAAVQEVLARQQCYLRDESVIAHMRRVASDKAQRGE